MQNYNKAVYRPDRGKSISTGQRPVNDGYAQQICALKGHQPLVSLLLSPFQGFRVSVILFRRALPYANAKRALPFFNDINNYTFFISHF
jgi:hypothetical protein